MRIVLALAAALLSTAPAFAADPPLRATAEAAPTPRALQLAGRLRQLRDTESANSMASMLMGPMIAGLAAKKGQLTKEEARDFAKAVDEALPEAMAVHQRSLAGLYAKLYTEEELSALVAFYESDVGRSINGKQIQASMLTAANGMGVMFEVTDRAKKAFCVGHASAKLCVERPGKAPTKS